MGGMFSMRSSWLVALGILGLPSSVYAENEKELLALVRAGQQSAMESIHTLSCVVTLEESTPSLQRTATGRYWRAKDVARSQQETPTGTVDWFLLYKTAEIREVVRNRAGTDQPPCWTGRRTLDDGLLPLDVWPRIFMEFDRFLEVAKGAPRVKRVKIDGRDCIRVTMDILTQTEKTYWFDVGRNYLVSKSAEVSKDHRTESENLDYVEPQPGVFFPTKRVAKTYRGSEQRSHVCVTLSDVRINEPLADDVFRIPMIPSGTTCSDWIRKQRYPIDENWQQIPGSKTEPLAMTPLPTPSSSSGEGTQYTAQSTGEPKSWTRWIAWGSLAILLLASTAWVYRRYQARSQQRG